MIKMKDDGVLDQGSNLVHNAVHRVAKSLMRLSD